MEDSDIIRIAIDLRFANHFESFWQENDIESGVIGSENRMGGGVPGERQTVSNLVGAFAMAGRDRSDVIGAGLGGQVGNDRNA